jgi:hypothetical protein
MTTPTIKIKQDLDRQVEQIRSNRDLSPEARQRYIAEAYEKAQAEYREAIETQEREIRERVSKTEREVFHAPYPFTASDTEKAQLRALRRKAYDDVYYSVTFSESPQETVEELERLLQRAERTGDPELATAVYHVATERGSRKVADAYLESRPKERERWESYVEARTEAESVDRVLAHAMGFGLMKPPELNSYVGDLGGQGEGVNPIG